MATPPTDRPAQGRARPLVWTLAGVVVGLLVLIAKMAVAPGRGPENAAWYVIGGGIAGWLLHILRPGRR